MGSTKSKPFTKTEIETNLENLYTNIQKYCKAKIKKLNKNERSIKFLLKNKNYSPADLKAKAGNSIRYIAFLKACTIVQAFLKRLVLNSDKLYKAQKNGSSKQFSHMKKCVPWILSTLFLTMKLRIDRSDEFCDMIEKRFSKKFLDLAKKEVYIDKNVSLNFLNFFIALEYFQ